MTMNDDENDGENDGENDDAPWFLMMDDDYGTDDERWMNDATQLEEPALQSWSVTASAENYEWSIRETVVSEHDWSPIILENCKLLCTGTRVGIVGWRACWISDLPDGALPI